MKIVFQAFRWDCVSPTYKIENFLQECKLHNGQSFRNRISYFFKDGGFWVGLILTVKNMRKFVTLVESQQAVTLDVHELGANEKIADFNFFVLNPNTGYGLYQHYHHSCSLNTFNYFAKSNYNEYRRLLLQAKRELYEKEGRKKSEITRLMKNYQGKFSSMIIQREGTFIDKIRSLKDAQAAEIEFAQISYSSSPFQPIQPFLKTLKYKMSFLDNTSASSKVRGIVSMLTSSTPKKATIQGIDQNGNDVVYRLFNDFDRFKEYNYEDFVPSLYLDQARVETSITKNDIVTELKSVFKTISPSFP